jgi:hypothetical protein
MVEHYVKTYRRKCRADEKVRRCLAAFQVDLDLAPLRALATQKGWEIDTDFLKTQMEPELMPRRRARLYEELGQAEAIRVGFCRRLDRIYEPFVDADAFLASPYRTTYAEVSGRMFGNKEQRDVERYFDGCALKRQRCNS